ncbi:MAG: apolipoprotein N-acyltransferase [Deltaproteobacteria bacterium]|nr:apolipoprotein N-acyltransferase [Deltaproteobacteria bacterium]
MKLKSIFLILLSVLLSVLSHPTVIGGSTLPNLGFLAWIAWVPLFLVVLPESPRKQFYLTFIYGFFFYLGATYWLYNAMHGFGGLSPLISSLVLLLLSVILGAYFAITFLIASFLNQKVKLSYFISLPILLVAVEWGRTHWPVGGFPWAQVGYTQYGYLPLIQFADWTGVYGVSALICLVNVYFYELYLKIRKGQKEENKSFVIKSIFTFTGLLFILIYGQTRIHQIETLIQKKSPKQVALVQGNIPQDQKWSPQWGHQILSTYQRLTRESWFRNVDLVVWPETAYPFDLPFDQENVVRELLGDFHAPLLFGAVGFDSKHLQIQNPEIIFNSAVLMGQNQAWQFYHKQHLVPYGEYVPFQQWLPFLKKLTAQVGQFQPGNEFNLLQINDFKLGSLICYEDIFPQIARRFVQSGANLLVNLSNDAWYGNTSALPQHLSFSTFRAIENRRYLVRATNTGVTSWVDPTGKIELKLPLFQEGILIAQPKLLEEKSFYSHFGDLFAYVCLALGALMVLLSCKKNKSK